LLASLLIITLIVTSINLGDFPARFKDEGVYLSQAWAVQTLGQLANYTYWYDHPPVGWIQISLWTILTDGFGRHADNPLLAGREFMVIVRLATVTMLFVLARRIGMRRSWAAIAVLLYALSPLSVQFGRYVLLDSIAMPWLLASLALAFSPKRRMSAAIGSALCLTMAILTKETLLVVVPAVLYAAWMNYRGSQNRKYAMLTLSTFAIGLIGFYPLLAIIKGELFPGPGHVSLLSAIEWQLVSRKGSGSVFDPSSDARHTVDVWLNIEHVMPIVGAVASIVALGRQRLRPFAVAALTQLLMLLRTGYLPFMYVIGLLPFLALVIAGVGDWCWPRIEAWRQQVGWRATRTGILALVTAIGVIMFAGAASKPWQDTLAYQFRTDADAFQRQAIAWVTAHVPRSKTLVVEGETWLDYVSRGYSRSSIIWVYKVDTDPAVQAALGRWENIDYLVLSGVTLVSEDKATFPLVFKAVAGSDPVITFGTGEDAVHVLKVRK
jgi:4-amino-4-deoxy-L-arabinose transferase-like glycosyltransferase